MEGLGFVVIGIGDESGARFSKELSALISRHRVFSGGIRHRELLGAILPKDSVWIDVSVPLKNVFDEYRRYDESILVFASGDPLFFGYTATLMREFPGLVRQTFPYFNSLQLLAHALCIPYHDMRVCSLTGRPWYEFDKALIERTTKLGVLTDRKNTPSAIAERMLRYGYRDYRMHIGVCLGGEREEVYTLSLEEVSGREFKTPNCILLEATKILDFAQPLGLREDQFALLNGRTKMITKMPIRLLSLSMLELHSKKQMWDIGFCTGSVSIEAKLQFPHLMIHSFEVRSEGRELISTNSERFGTPGIDFEIGDFMELDVSDLPCPDAVFIGGHGGRLIDFLHKIGQYINPKGVIVFNSVSEETYNLFTQGISDIGWEISSKLMLTLDDHNPIKILQARATKDHLSFS